MECSVHILRRPCAGFTLILVLVFAGIAFLLFLCVWSCLLRCSMCNACAKCLKRFRGRPHPNIRARDQPTTSLLPFHHPGELPASPYDTYQPPTADVVSRVDGDSYSNQPQRLAYHADLIPCSTNSILLKQVRGGAI